MEGFTAGKTTEGT